MRELLRRHHISFQHAWDGVKWAFMSQPNFRVHTFLSVVAMLLGVILRISRFEFIVIVFTILLGLTTEMLNTAVEAVTDLVTTEWRKEAKVAKDVSAGMMLIVAFGALCIGVVIYFPYIFRLITGTA